MALGRSPVTETLVNVSIIIFTLEFCPFTLEGVQGTNTRFTHCKRRWLLSSLEWEKAAKEALFLHQTQYFKTREGVF